MWGLYGGLMWIYITTWSQVTHICAGYLTIIGSGDGLSPGRRQAIIWTNARIVLDTWKHILVKSWSNFIHFHSSKCISKCHLENGGHFVLASMCRDIYGYHRQNREITIIPSIFHSTNVYRLIVGRHNIARFAACSWMLIHISFIIFIIS